MTPDPRIEIVICTFDNRALLERTLESVAAQQVPSSLPWGCLVVQNNCGDGTPDLVDRVMEAGRIPGLRTVNESVQGLTPARAAGVRHTTAPWVAFVDDDCALSPDWVAKVGDLTRRHPMAAALGGQVILDWERDPPDWLGPYGYCFAEQRLGAREKEVAFLVGAGLVVRRQALEESGWSRFQWVQDRIGKRLVSGGDVELVLRIGATGYPLIYAPQLQLLHRVPVARTQRPYLTRMHIGLGGSAAYADVLTARSPGAWRRTVWSTTGREGAAVIRAAVHAVRRWGRPVDVLMKAAFALGYVQSAARLALKVHRTNRGFLGAAAESS